MIEINQVYEERTLCNQRPLEEEDFYHAYAKEAFRFLMLQMNSQLELELN